MSLRAQSRVPVIINTDPRPPRKRGRLFLIIGGLILAIVIIAFWGLNISHYAQMQ